MKKIINPFISIVLTISLLLSFAGCSSDRKTQQNTTLNSTSDSINASVQPLVVNKIASFYGESIEPHEGGIEYYSRDNQLYGVLSNDGQHDTGAKFERVFQSGNYFEAVYNKPNDYNNIKQVNCKGLIDGNGNKIIPFNYAGMNCCNNRYVQVFTATSVTDNKSEAVFSIEPDSFVTSVSSVMEHENNIYYNGFWQIYDIQLGSFVPGLKITYNDIVTAEGNFFQYKNENGEFVKSDADGNIISDNVKIFSNGSYIQNSIVYDADGNKLFEAEVSDKAYIADSDGDYYLFCNYADSAYEYKALDSTGKVVSETFPTYFSIYGDFIFCDKKIYTFDGKQIDDNLYLSVQHDSLFNNGLVLTNENNYSMIDTQGQTLVTYDKSDYSIYEFIIKNKNTEKIYSHKDKDFTIEGNSFAPWLVESDADENFKKDIIDTISGEHIIKNYDNYYKAIINDKLLYVYAKNDNGLVDVYLVSRADEKIDIEQLKTDLLTDLSNAFAAEGITVTIDKTTGELALDSSVLFGGDSAELTSDGKVLLDSFMNAYTSIVFNDKYKDFVQDTIIEGHTAPVPGTTYEDGIELSIERAKNVLNYCLNLKTSVDINTLKDTFTSIGCSSSKPVFDENGEVVMDACRRVSFRIIVNTHI